MHPIHIIPELPEAAVAAILQHMPLQQRLKACSVCKSWKAIAATLPAHVSTDVTAAIKRRNLKIWLANFGHHVTSITLVGSNAAYGSSGAVPFLLPPFCFVGPPKLPRLRFVSLTGLKLELPQDGTSDSSRLTVAEAFPQLQAVSLVKCVVNEHLLQQLAAFTRLTKLHLCEPLMQHLLMYPASAVPQLLQKLPNLSDLLLRSRNPTQAAIAPLSSMQRLQRLSLDLWDGADTLLDTSSALPTTLTHLELVKDESGVIPTTARFKWGVSFSTLPNLRQLRLSALKDFSPSILAELSGLQHLQLAMEVRHPAGVGHPVRVPACYSAGALLTALQGMTQLQHLQLTNCRLHTLPKHQRQQQQHLPLPAPAAHGVPPQAAADQQHQLELLPQQQYDAPATTVHEQDGATAACFSALTASSQLTALCISQFGYPPLPSAAVLDTLFPPGRVFKELATIRFEWQPDYLYMALTAAKRAFSLSAVHVLRLGQSCPVLQEVALVGVLSPTFNVGCLLHLPRSLTSLHGLSLTQPEAAQVTELTQLRGLSCYCVGSEALLQLTGLTRLTELHVGVQNLLGKCFIGTTRLVDSQKVCTTDIVHFC